MIQAGEIYLLKARTGLESVRHPYLVLGREEAEPMAEASYLCCMVSTNAKKANWPHTIPLSQGEGGLERRSYLLGKKRTIIKESEFGALVGRLDAERMEGILGAP